MVDVLIGRDVTVIGGGIAGLSVALATAMHGAQVTVLERSPAITEVGAGIQVSPNGWRVLQALGVADAIAATSPKADRVRLRDFRHGRDVFTVPVGGARGPYRFVHRADFIEVLAQAAEAAGVVIRTGVDVMSVRSEGARTVLGLENGAEEQVGLTLAADGLHSRARVALNPKSKAFFTGQVAWRTIVPLDEDAPLEAQVFMGPGRHLVCYPLRDRRMMNIVAVEERDWWAEEGWNHRDDPAHLMRAFQDFCPEVRDLLKKASDVYLWGLFRHPVAPVWHDGALALLGDAAHPTLPFLAQGANMALEDAFVLARCLALGDGTDVTGALAQYQAQRRDRTARIVAAANDNAANYHLRPGPFRLAAHTALRLAGRFAPHAVTGRLDWIYRYDAAAGFSSE